MRVKRPITIRIPDELRERLALKAQQQRRELSDMIRIILEDAVSDIELPRPHGKSRGAGKLKTAGYAEGRRA